MEKKTIKLKPSTISGFVKAVSGLLITADNPHGIPPKELYILTAIVKLFREGRQTTKEGNILSREDRIAIANETSHTIQVVTNYVQTLKRKKALTPTGVPIDLFLKDRIEIVYADREEQVTV